MRQNCLAAATRTSSGPGHIRPTLVAAALVWAWTLPGAATAGSLTFYSTRAAFDAANPGLATQTFEVARNFGSVAGFDGPLNSTTNNGLFKPGDILPGVAFDSHPALGPGGQGLAVTPDGYFNINPNAPKVVVVNNSLNTLDVLFSPGQKAVAFDVYNIFFAGANQITLFGPGDTPLGSTTVTTTPDGSGDLPGFFGVSSDVPITRINLSAPANVGVAAVEFAPAVPEPGGLTLAGVCGLGVLARVWRRRRAA
jgi:hypothetical protein